MPLDAKALNEEPFGTITVVLLFGSFDGALEEANPWPFRLAAYAYTHSTRNSTALASRVESRMLTMKHKGLSSLEVSFGRIKVSGSGSEGGREAAEVYLEAKLVSYACF